MISLKKIVFNTVSNVLERGIVIGFSFIQIVIYTRTLGLDGYGLIGTISGISAILGFLNVSLESNLMKISLRDIKEGSCGMLKKYYSFFMLKAIILFAAYASIPLWLEVSGADFVAVLAASVSAFTLIIFDSWIAPVSILLSARLKHHIVAKFAFFRAIIGCAFLLPVIIWPNLVTIAIKDVLFIIVAAYVWVRLASNGLGFRVWPLMASPRISDLLKAWLIIKKYVGWVHLNSSITNVVYRADLYFLAMFHPLGDVGKYNIALGLAGLVNVLTMILGYQNTLAIANANQQDKPRVALNFLIASCLIGVIMALFFYFTADLLIWLVSGVKDPEISKVLLLLVLALLVVKSFASPFVSMVLTSGDVKRYALRVSVPLFVVAATCYYGAAKWGTLLTLSQANVVVALVWLALVIYEAQRSGVLKKFLGQHR